jgi:hypothetical protein
VCRSCCPGEHNERRPAQLAKTPRAQLTETPRCDRCGADRAQELGEAELAALMRLLDTDGDGAIDLAEFGALGGQVAGMAEQLRVLSEQLKEVRSLCGREASRQKCISLI